MSGKAGGIVGVSIALLLVAALAATPFYLGMLQSPSRSLDSKVEPDVEVVRRATATLDHEVTLLSYMYATAGDKKDLDREAAARFVADNPNTFSAALVRDLDKMIVYLEGFEARDRERGTIVLVQAEVGKGSINRLRPKAENIVRDVQPYYKEHENLIRKADGALNVLRSASAADLSAANHLDANRVRAVYLQIKARFEADRAAFEHEQAGLTLAAAQERALKLEKMKARLSSLATQNPESRIEVASSAIETKRNELSALKETQGQLESIIQSRQSEHDRLSAEATYARGEMDRLTELNLPFEQFMQKYGDLSDTVRVAEARVAALQFGTLKDASELPQDGPDPTPPMYEGGTPEPGLELLNFRASQLKESIAATETLLARLEKELSALKELSEKIQKEEEDIKEEMKGQSASLKALVQDAADRSEKASKSEEASLKLLKEAVTSAKSAISAAKKRASDAGSAARSGEKVDDRLQRVSQDFETEAYLQTILGQAYFASAQVRFARMMADESRASAVSTIRDLMEDAPAEQPADDEAVRTDSLNDLAEAIKAFDQSATLIGRINVRFADNTSATGKNYVWQAEVGKAACHLLHSAIVAADTDASFSQQELAYNILKGAVEKREQSPLLAPAMDTLIYLQKNVR